MKTMARKRKPSGAENPPKKPSVVRVPPVRHSAKDNPWPDLLRRIRKESGNLTQVEAAAKAKISARAWIAWENNQRKPSSPALQLLKIAFPKYF